MEEAHQVQASIGYPAIIRPSFTMGGSGGGIAYNKDEFIENISPKELINEIVFSLNNISNKEINVENLNLNQSSNVLVIGCEGDTDQEMYQKLINQN